MSFRITNVCEGCRRSTELQYVRRCDAYLCEDCDVNAVEEIVSEEMREDD